MADPLLSAKQRLARANVHIESVNRLKDAFFDTKPCALVIEQSMRGHEELKVRFNAELPEEITWLTIEAVEGLRSSLDHLAFAIAIAINQNKPIHRIYFPIGCSNAHFEQLLARYHLSDLPANILSRLREFKPYKGGDNILWALHAVRCQSVHRLIYPTVAQMSLDSAEWEISRPGPLTIPAPNWNWEKHEIVLAETRPGTQFQYNGELACSIAFGPVEAIGQQDLICTLDVMSALTEKIIIALESEARTANLFT
jgi:hypothetical protein